MEKELSEFCKEQDLDFEDIIMEIDDSYKLEIVNIGYRTNERQSKTYFNDEIYMETADLYNLEEGYPYHPKMVGMYLLINHYDEEYFIYDSCTEAQFAMKDLENSLYPSLDDEVRKEHNNSGHFHSYNMYNKNRHIIDGAFDLADCGENCIQFSAFEEKTNDEYGLTIVSIEKESEHPSWKKFYEIGFSDLDGNFICTPADMSSNNAFQHRFHQGHKRTMVDVIENLVNLDEMLKDLDEIQLEL